MIGLEYICELYGMEYKEVAEKLEITPQTINSWLRGLRKIPKERLKQLSDLFGIKEDYFEKRLTKIDKIDIQLMYFTQMNNRDSYEFEDEDDDGYKYMRTFYPYQNELEYLHWERQHELLLLRIEKFISEDDLVSLHDNYDLVSDVADCLEDEKDRGLLKVFLDLLTYRNPDNWVQFQPQHSWSQKKVSFFAEFDVFMKKHDM